MLFSILGPLVVTKGDDVVAIQRATVRKLLAVLIVNAGTTVSREALVAELGFNDFPPDRQAHNVQTTVSRLRMSLRASTSEEVIVREGRGYRLVVDPEAIDTVRFERLVEEAARRPAHAARLAREALGLWRGPPLEEFAQSDFAKREIARLQEIRLHALEIRIQADLDAGGHEDLLDELALLVQMHPIREGLWGKYMLALYRSGMSGEALQVFRLARHVLAERLGIEPGKELRDLEAAIWSDDPALTGAREGAPELALRLDNLPVRASTFVGRTIELEAVETLLERSRFVTLTGPIGVGKTSLAIEVAARTSPRYKHGVCHVRLDTVDHAAGVVPAVLSAFDQAGGLIGDGRPLPTTDTAAVVDAFRSKAALLVLDGCDQVVKACASVVSALAAECPGVAVLSTGRRAIAYDGEVVWIVPPMRIAGECDAGSDAITLFEQRAAAARRGVAGALDPSLVRRIVERTDGLPLAIELAAGLLRALTLPEIERRLDGMFDGSRPIGDRGLQLQAAIDGSIAELDPDAQAAFCVLSVFHGPWTAQQAASLMAVSPRETRRLLDTLESRSLITPAGPNQHHMLATLREYGLNRLRVSGALDEALRRHSEIFLAEAIKLDAAVRGPGQLEALKQSRRAEGDYLAAIEWMLANDPTGSLTICIAMSSSWLSRADRALGADLVGRSLAVNPGLSPTRAHGILVHAALAFHGSRLGHENVRWAPPWERSVSRRPDPLDAGDMVTATREAVAVLRMPGTAPMRVASGLTIAGWVLGREGHLAEAEQLLIDVAPVVGSVGDRWWFAALHVCRANLGVAGGNLEAAIPHAKAALDGFGELGDEFGMALALDILGRCYRARDDNARAHERYQAILDLGFMRGDEAATAGIRVVMGYLALWLNDADLARSHFASALEAFESAGMVSATAYARNGLGILALREGSHTRARNAHRTALGDSEAADDREGAAYSRACLGMVALAESRQAEAVTHCRRSLEDGAADSRPVTVALALETLSAVAGLADLWADAAVLCGAVDRFLDEARVPRSGWLWENATNTAAVARRVLGDDRFAELSAHGRALNGQEAVRYAVGVQA